MAQQDTGKRAREDEGAGGALRKAPRNQVRVNAMLSDAVEGVTDHHHEAEYEAVRQVILGMRKELCDITDCLPIGVAPREEHCSAVRSAVSVVSGSVSEALLALENLYCQQKEDVRAVLWGEFHSCTRDEQAVRLYRLLKLWTDKKYTLKIEVASPGFPVADPGFLVEDPATGSVLARITLDGKLLRQGLEEVDFSAHYGTWGRSRHL